MPRNVANLTDFVDFLLCELQLEEADVEFEVLVPKLVCAASQALVVALPEQEDLLRMIWDKENLLDLGARHILNDAFSWVRYDEKPLALEDITCG